ncbi:MAG: 2OG-Fe(II) oxygenase [Gammaproteobacteria bacterium]
MSMLDLQVLKDTPLIREPFEFVIVKDFIREQALAGLMADFPDPGKPGSVPLPQVRGGAAFRQFVQDLEGPDFRAAVEEKFDIDLSGRPTMMTVRGQCRETDGKIHTDSKTKLITVLIYMNPPWESEGGRLRLLRSPHLEDAVTEVSPEAGTMLIFRRSDNSWHGHYPYQGRRRALQMNWVTDQSVVDRELKRHTFSSLLKTLNPFRRHAGDKEAAYRVPAVRVAG